MHLYVSILHPTIYQALNFVRMAPQWVFKKNVIIIEQKIPS